MDVELKNMSDNDSHLLQINDLKTYFFTPDGVARAVDGVSFHMDGSETLGLVGESGCGKSVTALSIMGLLKEPVGRTVNGQILFKGNDLLKCDKRELRSIRGDRISMIFQEPMTSLNPVFTIGDQIAETLVVHQRLNRKAAWEKSVDMLEKVHIPSPAKRAKEYPHQLSGGMRQRAMIAMALALDPEILIADEPTTALDVTIQAQIIDLMMELKETAGSSILMITHDLGVIAEMAQRIAVMYAGKIVEESNVLELFDTPLHPYTRGLLNSIPKLGERSDKGRSRLREIKGIVASPYSRPVGCSFHPRCPEVMDICKKELPQLKKLDNGRQVRCWMHDRH